MRHGLALIFLLFTPLSVGALAQIPETPTEVTDFEKLIDKAKADGVRVIIVDPKQVQKPKAARETDLQSAASRLQSIAYLARDRLSEILVALPKFPNHAVEAIISKSSRQIVILAHCDAWMDCIIFDCWMVRQISFCPMGRRQVVRVLRCRTEKRCRKDRLSLYPRRTELIGPYHSTRHCCLARDNV